MENTRLPLALRPASNFVSGLGVPGTTHVQAPGLGRTPTCRRPVMSPELGGDASKTWACDHTCRVPPPCPRPLPPEAQRPGSVQAARTCGSRGSLGQPESSHQEDSAFFSPSAPAWPPLSRRLLWRGQGRPGGKKRGATKVQAPGRGSRSLGSIRGNRGGGLMNGLQ